MIQLFHSGEERVAIDMDNCLRQVPAEFKFGEVLIRAARVRGKIQLFKTCFVG
jgi:hypothetical protein